MKQSPDDTLPTDAQMRQAAASDFNMQILEKHIFNTLFYLFNAQTM